MTNLKNSTTNLKLHMTMLKSGMANVTDVFQEVPPPLHFVQMRNDLNADDDADNDVF